MTAPVLVFSRFFWHFFWHFLAWNDFDWLVFRAPAFDSVGKIGFVLQNYFPPSQIPRQYDI
jgi:hypothetical protein